MIVVRRSSTSRLQDGSLKSNLGDLLRSTILDQDLSAQYGTVHWETDSRGLDLLKWFIPAQRLSLIGAGPPGSLLDLDHFAFMHSERDQWLQATQPYQTQLHADYSWQECLARGAGLDWKEQDYPLVLAPDSSSLLETEAPLFDVGLNFDVHPEWHTKRWPMQSWKELETLLGKMYSVSWQSGLSNFDEYILWMRRCRVIVTHDTLGLHLASALRKPVFCVAGPSESREYSYGRVQFLKPQPRSCMPCNHPSCKERNDSGCLNDILATSVADEIIGKLSSTSQL